jgi:NTP pyrophosphatase (non-canonical NTP hydrolase)
MKGHAMERDLSLREYQREAARTNRVPGNDLASIMVPLLGLAGEAGSLLTEYKKWLREGDRYRPFTDQVSEELGDILWYLATIAQKEGLDLQEIAEENLAKLQDRWLRSQGNASDLFPLHRYDTGYPPHEQLPLCLTVEFREIVVNGARKLETTTGGQPFGDHLTDNSHVDDAYRYHDVFHLTNAILLGWSPVVRKLVKIKRKSVPRIDEVEDGARARVTEEAVSAYVFGVARDYSFFEGANSVDFSLLRTIRLLTHAFEVRDRSLRDWEEAILAGYRVWREMVAKKGGTFFGDAATRTVEYRPLADAADD